MLIRIIREWIKWRRNWDSLCNRCGKCCYSRTVTSYGDVIIHYGSPCENLDTQTHMCRVYDDRFRKCNHCGKVNLLVALFAPSLPHDCAYARTFRLWRKTDADYE